VSNGNKINNIYNKMEYGRWCLVALFGFALRIFIIQTLSKDDNYLEGKFNIFTDLDYKVYLDASLYDSPYERHTYRYSPILAWIMSPSYAFHQNFGKWLLATFDLIACFFFFKIFADRKDEVNRYGSVVISGLIFTNPFLIYLSIRGSCEGITMTLAAAFLYFYFGGEAHGNMSALERRGKGIIHLQPCRIRRYISYVLFGLWVHFRVFPVILLPLLIMYEFYSVKKNRWSHTFKYVLEFGLVSGGVFIALAVYYYWLYGYEFLHETYFYHLTRRDNRHSRSVYFYDLYLNYEGDALNSSPFRNLMRALPFTIFLVFFSFYLIRHRSLFYCQGFIICYFVLFNKVITDQYYMWLFSFLYLILAETKQYKEGKFLINIWMAYKPMFICLFPVAFWAFFKYHLEHSSKVYTMYSFWCWNVFALVVQTLLITLLLISYVKIEDKKEIQNGERVSERAKAVKRD